MLPHSSSPFATDMTLVLGAESFILRNKTGYPTDPRGRQCLRNFIDLFLNAEKMYFTLPGSQEKGTPIIITRLGNRLQQFSRGAIELPAYVEQRVFAGFNRFLEDQIGEQWWLHDSQVPNQRWLRGWLSFQLLNPIVTTGHRYRVDENGERLISENGHEIWKSYRQRFEKGRKYKRIRKLLEGPPLIAGELNEYIKPEINRFNTLNEFLLCYAYDVYRRGWQYLEGVKTASKSDGIDAAYFPHELRNNALEAGTNKWEPIYPEQDLLWSWGSYIVNLLEEHEYQIAMSPERVAEYILAVDDAMKQHPCPKWSYINLFGKTGQARDDREFKDFLLGLQEQVTEIASIAHLPLLRMRENSTGIEVAKIGMGALANFFLPPIITPILALGSLSHLLIKKTNAQWMTKGDLKIEISKRRVINWFSKGTFGYRGLLSPVDTLSKKS